MQYSPLLPLNRARIVVTLVVTISRKNSAESEDAVARSLKNNRHAELE
jgi:hypothetical protein